MLIEEPTGSCDLNQPLYIFNEVVTLYCIESTQLTRPKACQVVWGTRGKQTQRVYPAETVLCLSQERLDVMVGPLSSLVHPSLPQPASTAAASQGDRLSYQGNHGIYLGQGREKD